MRRGVSGEAGVDAVTSATMAGTAGAVVAEGGYLTLTGRRWRMSSLLFFGEPSNFLMSAVRWSEIWKEGVRKVN